MKIIIHILFLFFVPVITSCNNNGNKTDIPNSNSAKQLSIEELKEAVKAFSTSYVYAGNYTVEDTIDVVKHHRISTSIHSPVGSTVRRAFTFSGDTIILRVLNGNRRLKWIKQP